MTVPALFRAFPSLATRLPHRSFLPETTPITALSGPGLPSGVFVKRDEKSTPDYGGNKPRKLEFLIGAAHAQGAGRLLTTGGLGTNHGLATTLLARKVGIATTLILVDQPVTPEVRESLRLFSAWGAEVIDGASVAGAVLRGSAALSKSWLRGERPVLVPAGGSNPTGVLGTVSLALEIGEQVRAGVVPEPVNCYVAVGTGGSLAGLVLGLRLAGLATHPIGILVSDILPPTPKSLARLTRRTLSLLRSADAKVPEIAITPGDFSLVTRQLGPGYGSPTRAGRNASALAADGGLRLDPTYTAKGFAEVLARAREGALETPALFWNTFNGVNPWTEAPGPAEPTALPPRLRALAFEARPDEAKSPD
ncbi:MAG: pyridoxal-phosphate dependent enzyme [Myxococcales bacterium]|nr:pyridoxal-phosphate dependent enzyme [Myxococcales bacterium]